MNSPTWTFLAESEVSPSLPDGPDFELLDSPRSILTPAASSLSDGPTCPTSETCETLELFPDSEAGGYGSRPRRPVLRYFGGKFRLGPKLLKFFPPHAVYVEPFGGGASLLLHKARSDAEVYNDVDGELVNVFTVLRDAGPELIEKVRLTPYSRAEFILSHRPTLDPVERARRTIVRSFMGIGAMRTYIKADGSISPSGFEKSTRENRQATAAAAWMNYPESLWYAVDRIRGVIIENREAIEVIRDHDRPAALFYIDPPYCHDTRPDHRKSRYRHEMDEAAHENLASVLHAARGSVVVSGYRSPLYDRLYADWERRDMSAMTFLQRPRTECVWIRTNHRDLLS